MANDQRDPNEFRFEFPPQQTPRRSFGEKLFWLGTLTFGEKGLRRIIEHIQDQMVLFATIILYLASLHVLDLMLGEHSLPHLGMKLADLLHAMETFGLLAFVAVMPARALRKEWRDFYGR